jgi:hypothetical protein
MLREKQVAGAWQKARMYADGPRWWDEIISY